MNRHQLVKTDPSQEDEATELAYQMPVPPYSPICGPKAQLASVTHNLMSHFVDMTVEGFGEVIDLAGMVQVMTG